MANVSNTCNTGLSLGLGSVLGQQEHHLDNKCNKKSSPTISDPSFPSLSLALLSEPLLTNELSPRPIMDGKEANSLKRQASSISIVSSFSNSNSVKKETEREMIVLNGEEDQDVKVENKVSRIITSSSDHDHDQDDVTDHDYFGTRKKLRLRKDQSFVLEESFKEHTTLINPKQKQALAKRLNLWPRQVEVWFQNRRARTKLKQTEVDSEMLKRYCETLTDENLRLKKEVQDLKAYKGTTPTAAATPFDMQLSAATVTLCPSCQRISPSTTNSAVTQSSSKSRLTLKPRSYTTDFAHSSAASYSSTLQSS